MTAAPKAARMVAEFMIERKREEGVENRGHMLVHAEMLHSIEARGR